MCKSKAQQYPTLDYKLRHLPTQIHERDGNSRLQTVTSAYTNT